MATQAEAEMVAALLEQDWEGFTSNHVARQIIDAIRKSDKAKVDKTLAKEKAAYRSLTTVPEVGTAFKTPFSATTYIVAWTGTEMVDDYPMMWCVSSDSNLGWTGYTNSPLMKIHKDAAIRQATIDKILAPTVDLRVGDRLLFRQDLVFRIEAMFSRGALLRHEATGLLYPEENSNLAKYYRKRVGK